MFKYNPKWIYLLRVYERDYVTYKIGYTKNDPKKRVPQLQTGNKNEIEIVHTFWSEFGTRLEVTLHNIYKSHNERGEWYSLTKKDVDNFLNICEKYEKSFKLLYENNTYLQNLK